MDAISKQEIKQLLDNIPYPTDVILLDSVDSTNTYAKSLAQNNAPSGTCVIAKKQTDGRGRLGRSFYSPSDTGIYMSIIFRPETDYAKSVPHTIAACVAVCKALEKYSTATPSIKWVNDIFCGGKKVCGILTEGGSVLGKGIDYYIIGIGINTATPDGGFPDEIKQIAGAVSGIFGSRNQITASVISEFLDLCNNSSIESIISEYKKHSFILGKPISYIKNGKTILATAIDINMGGNLIVRTSDGAIDTLISGEVSLSSENFAD